MFNLMLAKLIANQIKAKIKLDWLTSDCRDIFPAWEIILVWKKTAEKTESNNSRLSMSSMVTNLASMFDVGMLIHDDGHVWMVTIKSVLVKDSRPFSDDLVQLDIVRQCLCAYKTVYMLTDDKHGPGRIGDLKDEWVVNCLPDDDALTTKKMRVVIKKRLRPIEVSTIECTYGYDDGGEVSYVSPMLFFKGVTDEVVNRNCVEYDKLMAVIQELHLRIPVAVDGCA
jgi:hypothetical protein